MNLNVDPKVVTEITEAIKTLNLNLGLNLESQSGAEAAKWIAGFLIAKTLVVFLLQIGLYVLIAYLAGKFLIWLAKAVNSFIQENTKVRLEKVKVEARQRVLDEIDWAQMKEALDAWYADSLKKSKKAK